RLLARRTELAGNSASLSALRGPFLTPLAAIEERRPALSSSPALPEAPAFRVPSVSSKKVALGNEPNPARQDTMAADIRHNPQTSTRKWKPAGNVMRGSSVPWTGWPGRSTRPMLRSLRLGTRSAPPGPRQCRGPVPAVESYEALKLSIVAFLLRRMPTD